MTTFQRAIPTFSVSDVETALDFWIQIMEFTVAFTKGNPVCFAILNRDTVDVHINLNPEAAGSGRCHIVVEGLDAVYESCMAGGITIKQPPTVQSWGFRDLLICDSDGNTLEIAEDISNLQM